MKSLRIWQDEGESEPHVLRRKIAVAAGLIGLSALIGVWGCRKNGLPVPFMADLPQVRTQEDASDSPSAAMHPGMRGAESVYKADFAAAVQRAEAYLPQHGFSITKEYVPGWRTWENASGESYTLIRGDRLSKGAQPNDPNFVSVVAIRASR